MRPFGLIDDPIFDDHDTGPDHPERPDRTRRLREALAESGLAERCMRLEPVLAETESIARCHDSEYIGRVEAACAAGESFLDSMDVAICPRSERIARLAAGSVTELALQVANGDLRGGFASVRPPGHHAERNLAMGFCLYNSVAIAARELQAKTDIERVLIVDWDVHHGNGTQHIFEDDPTVFYFSCHQVPLYPGTGMRDETGVGAGEGFTLNCPLDRFSGDHDFLAALSEDLVSAAEEFQPEFVILSAGFDAHIADPLAELEVSTEAYEQAATILKEIAGRYCGGKLVSALEGGYDLEALAASACRHLDVLLGPA